ncbi:hypothetical protein DFH06DRAFT_1198253 [Mycena polygramma]|nr:hypothetical protein DFH06DRAFT_1198253 [Mycena polygramma]
MLPERHAPAQFRCRQHAPFSLFAMVATAVISISLPPPKTSPQIGLSKTEVCTKYSGQYGGNVGCRPTTCAGVIALAVCIWLACHRRSAVPRKMERTSDR